jgi:hypothetical protein
MDNLTGNTEHRTQFPPKNIFCAVNPFGFFEYGDSLPENSAFSMSGFWRSPQYT